MILVRILKYLAGYVVFTARGGFAERFINLCAVGRVQIWDLACFDGYIRGKISVRDFRKLRKIVRKTGVRLSITDKIGLPFYLNEHKNRVGIMVCAVVYVVFCIVMNRFVWCIHTTDSDNFSREQIISAAENAGLHHGVYVPSFDEEKAAREIYKAFDGNLSWVKVNIKGSLAVIEYREKSEKLQIEEKGQPSNIVADFDGVIVSDETYQGTKNISRGNAVRKGDVLISGVVEGIDQKPLYYEAKGKFSALHSDVTELTLSCDSELYGLAHIRKVWSAEIFGFEIPLGFGGYTAEEGTVFSAEFPLEYDGHILPFKLKKTTFASVEKTTVTEDVLQLIGVLNYTDLTYDKYRNTNIVSYDISQKNQNNSITISGEYQCIDFIGESKTIIIEIN